VAKADPTVAFFDELATRSDEPLLRKATGVAQLEVVDGRTVRRWVVDIDRGRITVPGSGDPTCVIRANKAVFDKIASGRLNAVAAVLRGDVAVDGDWRLLVRLQRLFPSPPRRRAKS
jgi:hypothetical protein